jgi:fructose-bisphosphate aldolase class 1
MRIMTIMTTDRMLAQISGKEGGFIAAPDQSGRSTPDALSLCGIPDNTKFNATQAHPSTRSTGPRS